MGEQGRGEACTLGNLRTGCVYSVRVRACNAQGQGDYCKSVDVSTAPGVPDEPEALRVSAPHQSALEVRWERSQHDGGAPLTAFRLEVAEFRAVPDIGLAVAERFDANRAPRGLQWCTVFDGISEPAGALIEGGLLPGMQYLLRVFAVNSQGTSASSSIGEWLAVLTWEAVWVFSLSW